MKKYRNFVGWMCVWLLFFVYSVCRVEVFGWGEFVDCFGFLVGVVV